MEVTETGICSQMLPSARDRYGIIQHGSMILRNDIVPVIWKWIIKRIALSHISLNIFFRKLRWITGILISDVLLTQESLGFHMIRLECQALKINTRVKINPD